MAIEYDHEEMYEKYRLSDEQKKACDKVFSAMKNAGKLGIKFWDMYGTLTAYNGNVFRKLHMRDIPNSIQIFNCKGDGIDHCDYYTTIDCDECKYGGGRKNPEAKCNQNYR